MRKLELKRRLRSAVVPTDPGEVKALLRQLAEPITLFGEREVISQAHVTSPAAAA